MSLRRICFGLAAIVVSACTVHRSPEIVIESFGALSSGEPVSLYRLVNASGSSMEVIDYGCRIVRISVPDRDGRVDDVVVGYGDMESFECGRERFFGALIGRYGNRIAGASFRLDDREVRLTPNETLGGKPVHLHGGTKGFDRVMWHGEPLEEPERVGVRFSRRSPDGEEGYPGNLDCTVTYWWTNDDVCRIEYAATTDRPTVVNLSNHTYFNLKGSQGGYVMDHLMQVEADYYFRNNEQFVPDGAPRPVDDTPFDMRQPCRVDHAIDRPDEQLRMMRGFSVCWVLRDWDGSLAKAADLRDARSGRGVEVWTTEPGLLTYTGRGLSDRMIGKEDRPLEKFGGMLLETLHFADSPNRPEFPSTVLRPGERYRSVTEFRFYAE